MNRHDIQRYNQGFGGFGPLEKCSTGKLVLAKDIIPILDFYEEHATRVCKETTAEIIAAQQDRSVYAGLVASLSRELVAASIRTYWLSAIAIAEGVLLIVATLPGVS
jgi:hypothetical protein